MGAYNTSSTWQKLAGVSQATVSRAFNPASNESIYAPAVLDAASALKYAPDAIARVLSNSTNIVAVIMQNTTNPFYTQRFLASFLSGCAPWASRSCFYLDDDHMKDLIHQICSTGWTASDHP